MNRPNSYFGDLRGNLFRSVAVVHRNGCYGDGFNGLNTSFFYISRILNTYRCDSFNEHDLLEFWWSSFFFGSMVWVMYGRINV